MKQITTKQFSVIAFMVIMALKMFMLPTLMIKTGGRDSWISMIIFILIEFAILFFILFSAKLCPDASFYDLLNKVGGKVGAKIILAIMSLYLLLKMCLIVGELKVFFTVSVFDGLNWEICLIPLMAFLVYLANSSLRGIGRLAEIFMPFIVLSMLALLLLVLGNTNFDGLLPMLAESAEPVLENVSLFPMWFGDLSVMAVFLGEIKQSKRFVVWGFVSAAAGAAVVLFFTAVLFATYGNIPDLLDYGHNISNMLLYSSKSFTYGRFDIPVFCVWITTVFIQLGLVFGATTRHVSQIFAVKQRKWVALGLAVILYAVSVFIFKNEHELYYICTEYPRFAAIFVEFLVPVLIFIAACVTHFGKKEKTLEAQIENNYL